MRLALPGVSSRNLGFEVALLVCPREGDLSGQEDVLLIEVRSSIGVLGLCCWLQKSARGVGFREATLVAAGVGDGGLAPRRFRRGAKGRLESGEPETGRRRKGLRRATSLVEDVRGCGSPQPSRAGGENGLGQVAWRSRQVLWRHGRQSYGARALDGSRMAAPDV